MQRISEALLQINVLGTNSRLKGIGGWPPGPQMFVLSWSSGSGIPDKWALQQTIAQ